MPYENAAVVTFSVESFSAAADSMRHLFAQHWQEIANYKDEIPLDIDYEQYRTLEDRGALFFLAARKANELIGYSIFFLARHPHYKSTLMAMNDVIYITPSERKGRTGIRLIKESELRLKRLGVQKISWHLKPSHDFSAILKRMGYMHEEIMLGKVI